ncbi:MAG: SCO family protein, partial [Armatimonadota bacterium]
MRRALALGLLALAALGSAQFYGYKEEPMVGSARVATEANAGTRVDQKLNDYVSLDTPFTDDKGRNIVLRDVIHDKPVILLPIFYQCPGVCTNELDQLTQSLQGFKKDNVGSTFDVVVLSIDRTEGAKIAALKKETYVDFYENQGYKVAGRKNTKDGWHFLTGTEESIQKLTGEIGFRFYRDSRNGNIVHPAALVVLTPHGKISRYFLSTEYPQRVLLDSIRAAG